RSQWQRTGCVVRPGQLEPEAGRYPHLAVGGVVDVRIPRDTHEPATPVDIDTGRPGFDHESFITMAVLVDQVECQAPVGVKMTSEKYMRVRLAGAEAAVSDGVR